MWSATCGIFQLELLSLWDNLLNIISIPHLASDMDQQTAGIRLYFIYNNNQSISDTKDDYK